MRKPVAADGTPWRELPASCARPPASAAPASTGTRGDRRQSSLAPPLSKPPLESCQGGRNAPTLPAGPRAESREPAAERNPHFDDSFAAAEELAELMRLEEEQLAALQGDRDPPLGTEPPQEPPQGASKAPLRRVSLGQEMWDASPAHPSGSLAPPPSLPPPPPPPLPLAPAASEPSHGFLPPPPRSFPAPEDSARQQPLDILPECAPAPAASIAKAQLPSKPTGGAPAAACSNMCSKSTEICEDFFQVPLLQGSAEAPVVDVGAIVLQCGAARPLSAKSAAGAADEPESACNTCAANGNNHLQMLRTEDAAEGQLGWTWRCCGWHLLIASSRTAFKAGGRRAIALHSLC